MMERERKRAEVAMKRRRGASQAHSDKVRAHMMMHDDLYTTCQACGLTLHGSLTNIMKHAEKCHGPRTGQ